MVTVKLLTAKDGVYIYEDDITVFDCPVCNMRNCLLHSPVMSWDYQEDLWIKAVNDKAAQETELILENREHDQEWESYVLPQLKLLYRIKMAVIG